MTNREFFTAIINANINADITAHATAEVAKLDKKNAKRKAEGGGVKEENKPIAEAILTALADGTLTSTELTAKVNTILGTTHSVNKVGGTAQVMAKNGTLVKGVTKVKNKGEVTTYTLVVAEDTAVADDTADEVADN
jgi:hypothetical protein